MKNILISIPIAFLLLVSCSVYQKVKVIPLPEVTDEFERLDTSLFLKTPDSDCYGNMIKDIKIKNGDTIETWRNYLKVLKWNKDNLLSECTRSENYYDCIVYIKDSPNVLYKEYYLNGNIKYKVLWLYNQFFVGKSYSYDESGKCTQVYDYDKGYTFTYENLLKYLQRNHIPLKVEERINNTTLLTIYKSKISDKKRIWYVNYARGKYYIYLKISGKNGRIISKRKTKIQAHN